MAHSRKLRRKNCVSSLNPALRRSKSRQTYTCSPVSWRICSITRCVTLRPEDPCRCLCGRDGKSAWFRVADTGPGIPPADLSHLFSPLYRGEASRNRRTGGTGLGLTIAQRILLAHGGDLQAENNLGGGAVFTASLSAAARSAFPASA